MPESVKIESTKTSDGALAAPVVVDMGKKPRKQIRQLRKGHGKLMMRVNDVLAELRTAGSISALAQPVVIVVRQRPKSRAVLWPLV
jgi:hypothetical protein